jgi:hypothetical protein
LDEDNVDFFISYVFLVLAYNMNGVFPLLSEMWQRLSTQILYNGFPKVWANSYKLIDVHCWELIRSVGSHGSLSMVFVMKVMVWHFVSDSHKVVTALFLCYI